MKTTIRTKLREIETEYGIEILYACESGSRAWGFASPDSDWDIRFIYAHPRSWYLHLFDDRDVIEHPFGPMADDLDFHGFDLRKALRLAAKSNPSILEWLHSPVIYEERAGYVEPLREAMAGFSPRALMQHYASLAERQYKAYWKAGEAVRFKKYLYALRPLLAVHHMAEHAYGMPPILFDRLRGQVTVPEAVRKETETLLEMKATNGEAMGRGRFPALDSWIEAEIGHCQELAKKAPRRIPDRDSLQTLFWRVLDEGPGALDR